MKPKFVLAIVACLAPLVRAQAAELKLTCTHALKAVVLELAPTFERETGHKLMMRFDVVGGIRRQIEAGDTFDVACIAPTAAKDLEAQGRIAPGAVQIARAGLGLAVRAGAARPDIGSVEAFKKTMLGAKSVAYSAEGQSGAYFRAMIDRLGIADELKTRLVATRPGQATAAVVSGEAEMLVVVTSSIVADPGVDLVGLLPQELQSYSAFALALSASSKEQQAAAELVKFLKGPSAVPTIRSKGMEPL